MSSSSIESATGESGPGSQTATTAERRKSPRRTTPNGQQQQQKEEAKDDRIDEKAVEEHDEPQGLNKNSPPDDIDNSGEKKEEGILEQDDSNTREDGDEEDVIDLSEVGNAEKGDTKSSSEADGKGDDSKASIKGGASMDVIQRIKQKTLAIRRNKGNGLDATTNTLTELIPGYTAPMTLNSSSLDKYRPAGGIRTLQHQAMKFDASTRDFVMGTKSSNKHVAAMSTTTSKSKKTCSLPTSYTSAYSSFKKGVKRTPDLTAGSGWFGMKPTPVTEELKTDLAVIRNRSYLDPKRFYKNADKSRPDQIVQLGTVIEGPSEYFSSRLTKKQRRSNITEEFMNDTGDGSGGKSSRSNYAQRKFKDMAREKTQKAQARNKTFNNSRKKKQSKVKKFY